MYQENIGTWIFSLFEINRENKMHFTVYKNQQYNIFIHIFVVVLWLKQNKTQIC